MSENNLFKKNLPNWLKLLDISEKKIITQNLRKYEDVIFYGGEIYPERKDIFKAFSFFPPEETKVVIIGQDPYHGPNQATGLSFANPNRLKAQPSLLNIFREIERSYQNIETTNDLESWAHQGVLLLNNSLTVLRGKPNSCESWGWDNIIKKILCYLMINYPNIHYMILGKFASNLINDIITEYNIDRDRLHLFVTSHPSPYSANLGFTGSNIFVNVNESLIKNNMSPVVW